MAAPLCPPLPQFDDIQLTEWVRSSLFYVHFIQPFVFAALVVLGVWNAASIYALRRERRVVRKLLDAVAPEIDPMRLAPMHWPRSRRG